MSGGGSDLAGAAQTQTVKLKITKVIVAKTISSTKRTNTLVVGDTGAVAIFKRTRIEIKDRNLEK